MSITAERSLSAWSAGSDATAALTGAASSVCCSQYASGDGHVYHQYVVRTAERTALRSFLSAAGIETAIHYPRTLLEIPGLAGRIHRRDECPHACAAAREVLSLPVHPWLTPAERQRCFQALRQAAEGGVLRPRTG